MSGRLQIRTVRVPFVVTGTEEVVATGGTAARELLPLSSTDAVVGGRLSSGSGGLDVSLGFADSSTSDSVADSSRS